jgi:hypothetical protein
VITVDFVLKLDAWVARAATEEERAKRIEQARAQLFPPGLDETEIKRRETLVELAAEARDPIPTPDAPSVEPASPTLPPWEGLIRRDSPAYRRGSIHDGTARQVERMRERARGSPFDADRKGKSR